MLRVLASKTSNSGSILLFPLVAISSQRNLHILNYEHALSMLNITDTKIPSEDYIKTAYKTRALELHPDRNPELDTAEDFNNLQIAYQYALKNMNLQFKNSLLNKNSQALHSEERIRQASFKPKPVVRDDGAIKQRKSKVLRPEYSGYSMTLDDTRDRARRDFYQKEHESRYTSNQTAASSGRFIPDDMVFNSGNKHHPNFERPEKKTSTYGKNVQGYRRMDKNRIRYGGSFGNIHDLGLGNQDRNCQEKFEGYEPSGVHEKKSFRSATKIKKKR